MAHEQYLFHALSKTLKDMAGLKIEKADPPSEKLSYTNVFLIDSYSPRDLGLRFFFTYEVKQLLVEKVLNTKWSDLTHEYIDDCLLELVNVISGNFFCKLYQGESYEIGLPYLTFDDRGIDMGDMFYFKVDDILIAVSIYKQ